MSVKDDYKFHYQYDTYSKTPFDVENDPYDLARKGKTDNFSLTMPSRMETSDSDEIDYSQFFRNRQKETSLPVQESEFQDPYDTEESPNEGALTLPDRDSSDLSPPIDAYDTQTENVNNSDPFKSDSPSLSPPRGSPMSISENSSPRNSPTLDKKQVLDLTFINQEDLKLLSRDLRHVEILSDCTEDNITYLAALALLSKNGYVPFTDDIVPNYTVAISTNGNRLKDVYLKSASKKYGNAVGIVMRQNDDILGIGNFKITWTIKKITSGSVGNIVYQRNEHRRGRYPFKEPRLAPPSNDPQMVQQYYNSIKKEVEIQQKLKHPHIVELFDAQEYTSRKGAPRIIIFAEQLPSTLDGAVAEKKGSFIDKIKWAKQLASALSFIHANGYTHNDIKGDNIYITEKGDLKLGDFGSSTEMNSGAPFNNGMIDPPEIIEKVKQGIPKAQIHRNQKTDAFQYGLSLWNMFKQDVAQQRLPNTTFAEMFKAWPNTEEYATMRALIIDCMNADPEKRPTMAQIQQRLSVFESK